MWSPGLNPGGLPLWWARYLCRGDGVAWGAGWLGWAVPGVVCWVVRRAGAGLPGEGESWMCLMSGFMRSGGGIAVVRSRCAGMPRVGRGRGRSSPAGWLIVTGLSWSARPGSAWSSAPGRGSRPGGPGRTRVR
jgi:hypothetical protein